jgi:16S rRNA (cytidine1402-2'-O)-methyltransferase
MNNMNFGKLILVPTPIDEISKLNPESFSLLLQESMKDETVIVVEDLKPARKRWLNFGLPREAIEKFVQLNEHNFKASTDELIKALKQGKNVYIMSDGGLPAFCDPGRELVYQCHKNKIKVTSMPFFNSVILALALSGLNHQEFHFQGFLPLDTDQRKKIFQSFVNNKVTTIVMDTPYRLKRLLEELSFIKKEIFLALDLNAPTEELLLMPANDILLKLNDFKREFVLIIPA